MDTIVKCRLGLLAVFGLVVLLFLGQICMAQEKGILRMPSLQAYKNPEMLWDEKTDTIQTYESPWSVWAAREDLKLFSLPLTHGGRQLSTEVEFLQRFLVVNKIGRYLLLCRPEDMKQIGWAPIEDLIIMNQAFKDPETTITNKAILVNRFESSDVERGRVSIVEPLLSPADNARPRGEQIKILEFASIFQYHYPDSDAQQRQKPDYVLIGKAPTFTMWDEAGPSAIRNIILGWVPVDRVLLWDTRQALEPHQERKFPIFYFENRNSLAAFRQNPERIPQDSELVVIHDTRDNIIRTSLPHNAPRYPIREDGDGYTVIGIPQSSLGEMAEDARVLSGIETEMSLASQLDVVFVIDGTLTMKPYLRDAGVAAEAVMDQVIAIKQRQGLRDLNLRFGAVVYRDYMDGEDVFDAARLTSDVGRIKVWLQGMRALNNEVFEENPEAFYPEAVFQGLVRAASDEMGWQEGGTKLIIQIGDAGNHSRGFDDYDEMHIAGLLARKDFSFASFHIVHPTYQNPLEKEASDLYVSQMFKILNHIRLLFNKKVEFMDWPEADKRKIIELNNEAFAKGGGRWYLKSISSAHEYSKAITDAIVRDSIEQIAFILNNLSLFRLGDLRAVTTYTSSTPLWVPQLTVSVRERLEKKFGKEVLKELMEKQARFYTEAFVVRSDPRSKMGDPPQFEQMVILDRNSVEDLLATFRILDRYGWPPDNRRISTLWEKMILHLTGEEDEQRYQDKSLIDIYKMVLGITFQNDHFLLQLPLKKVKEGAFDNEQIAILMSYLKSKYKHLDHVQKSDERWFRVFTREYIWLSSHELP